MYYFINRGEPRDIEENTNKWIAMTAQEKEVIHKEFREVNKEVKLLTILGLSKIAIVTTTKIFQDCRNRIK